MKKKLHNSAHLELRQQCEPQQTRACQLGRQGSLKRQIQRFVCKQWHNFMLLTNLVRSQAKATAIGLALLGLGATAATAGKDIYVIPCSSGLHYQQENYGPFYYTYPAKRAGEGTARRIVSDMSPHFADLDDDGDDDLLLGYQTEWMVEMEDPDTGLPTNLTEYRGYIAYFRNDNGTFVEQLEGDNPFFSFTMSVEGRVSLTLGDLDADGDLDAVINTSSGTNYWQNNGTASEANFGALMPEENPLNNLVLGGIKWVQDLADIDNDGDLDAVVSAGSQAPQLFRNTGTAESPSFVADAMDESPFRVMPDNESLARVCLFDFDRDGDLDALFVPSIRYFVNSGDANQPIFVEQQREMNPFSMLRYSIENLSIADLDKDGIAEIVWGRSEGNSKLRSAVNTESTPGDLDRDGDIDYSDARLATLLISGKIQHKACFLSAVDVAPLVDGVSQPDGKIDIGDAAVIFQMVEDKD